MALLAGGCASRLATAGGQGAAATATGTVTVGQPVIRSDIRPKREGAERYAAPAPVELARAIAADPLRPMLIEEVTRIAEGMGQPRPVGDLRLDAVAQDAADSLQGMETPSPDNLEFLAHYYGLVDLAPRLSLVRASATPDRELLLEASKMASELMKAAPHPIGRIGVGVVRGGVETLLVVALQEKNVDMAPLPRRMDPGQRVRVEGRLVGDNKQPEIIVTFPGGDVRTMPPSIDMRGGAFRADVSCDRGPGRYQIEVGASGRFGPGIAANFPIYCGVVPPGVPPPPPGPAHPGAWTVSESVSRILELVNRDRRAAGLPALALDDRLSAVARAHCQDMARNGFVGHVSPSTGDPEARVLRAGLKPQFLAENIGLALSPDDVHAGLMNSPGHRANVLEKHPSRIGIGVLWKKSPAGPDMVLVTELFM